MAPFSSRTVGSIGGGAVLNLEKKQNKENPKPHEKSYPLIFYELFHDRIPHPEDVSERFRRVMSPVFPEQTLLRAGWVPVPGAQTTDQSSCPRGKTKCALNVGCGSSKCVEHESLCYA